MVLEGQRGISALLRSHVIGTIGAESLNMRGQRPAVLQAGEAFILAPTLLNPLGGTAG